MSVKKLTKALEGLVNYNDSDPCLYDWDDDGVLGRLMYNAHKVLKEVNKKVNEKTLDVTIIRVKEKIGDMCRVIFSVYLKTPPHGYDDLDRVPVEGKIKIIMDYVDSMYESPVLESPTWLELCVHANDMIHKTQDYHHIFLEDIYVQKEKDGVKICEFSMGS